MFVREGIIRLFEKVCHDDEVPVDKTSTFEKFVVLDNGRLVPLEPGGMVEVALDELGGKIVEVEIPSGEKIDQEK